MGANPSLEIKEKNEKSSTKKVKVSKVASMFIGPMLLEPTPEEIARQKVLKFEEDLANSIIAEIKREVPPDWERDGALKVIHILFYHTSQS